MDFLSNHGHVFVCLARDQQALLRDVASNVGISERAVQQLVGDLERAGVIAPVEGGPSQPLRRRRESTLRHWLQATVAVGDFVELFDRDGAGQRRTEPTVEFPSGSRAQGTVTGPPALRSVVN